MQKSISTNWLRNSFFLAVLLHLLLFLTLGTQITFQPQKKIFKTPNYFVPAYVYKGSITPAVHQTHESLNASHQAPTPQSLNSPKQATTSHTQNIGKHESILQMSRDIIRADSAAQAIADSQSEAPVLLIGDDSQPANPLIKLLGRSLSAHFNYPKLEGNFGIRGKVLVGLILHPEGYYSDVELIESSDNPDFDTAALYAVNSAPRVIGADHFLSQPKHFIIGFIFD